MASAARFTRSRSFRNTVSRGVSALLFPHGPHLKSNGEGHRLSSLHGLRGSVPRILHVCVYVQTTVCQTSAAICSCTYIHTYMYAHACMYACIHTHTHANTHMYTHTHVHTYTYMEGEIGVAEYRRVYTDLSQHQARAECNVAWSKAAELAPPDALLACLPPKP